MTPICERYDVDKVTLFGSYARGVADELSDVDLMVDGGKLVGFEWGGFYADVEEALGVELDVLSRRSTRKQFLDKISRDEVLLYAR